MLGTIVGNYRVTRQIGQGGMGAVYEAEHVLLGKKVAIKVLLPERSFDKEIVDRFFNEAKATTMVHHPGIVEIFDFGHLEDGDNSSAYIVMELLAGESLGARLRKTSPLSVTNAVSIARHIAGVLSATHAHGIVHRDLKPDNVHLVPDPALPRGERAKILDFGIAKLAGKGDSGLVKTVTGRVMGTPMYMSPEQCRGSGQVDHRSDIYALGCVFYHMLVGRPPFIAEGAGEILAAHIHVQPQPPSVYQPTIPPQVEEVVMRLLEKDREVRFQHMDDVIVALNDVSEVLLEAGDDFDPSLAASKHFQALGQRKSTANRLQQPTTLGLGASESINTPLLPAARKKSWLIQGVVAAVLLAVIGVFAISTLNRTNQATKAATDLTTHQVPVPDPVVEKKLPESPPMEPAIDPSLSAPANAPVRTTVKLSIQSVPEGAKVYRVFDGVKIGVTPFTYTVLRGDGEGEAEFVMKKRKYRSQPFSMVVDEDNEVVLTLRKRRRGESDTAEKIAPRDSVGKDPEIKKAPEPKKPGKDEALDPFATSSKPEKPAAPENNAPEPEKKPAAPEGPVQ